MFNPPPQPPVLCVSTPDISFELFSLFYAKCNRSKAVWMLCWCVSERTTGATPVTDGWRLYVNTFAKLQIQKNKIKISQHRQLCIVQLWGILWQICGICLINALEVPSHWNVSERKTVNYKHTGGVNLTASESEMLGFKWFLLHFCKTFN